MNAPRTPSTRSGLLGLLGACLGLERRDREALAQLAESLEFTVRVDSQVLRQGAGKPVAKPALKLPDPSRLTMVLTVLLLVAAFAAFAPDATFAAVTPPTVLTTVAPCVPVTSPDNDPVKLVEEPAVVAVVALPFKLAVIVPALKLPVPSRLTMVLIVLLLVAAFAATVALATLVAV